MYKIWLRKQHCHHTCGFHFSDSYYLNAVLSWVQTDKGPESVWGEITYCFFLCYGASLIQYTQTHWGGQQALSKAGHFLVWSPKTLWLQHDFFETSVCLPQRDEPYSTSTSKIEVMRMQSILNSEFSWVWFPDEIRYWSFWTFWRPAVMLLHQRSPVFNKFLFWWEKEWVWGHDFSLNIPPKRQHCPY